jgi:hypothetical protein
MRQFYHCLATSDNDGLGSRIPCVLVVRAPATRNPRRPLHGPPKLGIVQDLGQLQVSAPRLVQDGKRDLIQLEGAVAKRTAAANWDRRWWRYGVRRSYRCPTWAIRCRFSELSASYARFRVVSTRPQGSAEAKQGAVGPRHSVLRRARDEARESGTPSEACPYFRIRPQLQEVNGSHQGPSRAKFCILATTLP